MPKTKTKTKKSEPCYVAVHVDTLKKLADAAGYNLSVKTRGSSGRKWLDPTLVRRDVKGKKHKPTFLEEEDRCISKRG